MENYQQDSGAAARASSREVVSNPSTNHSSDSTVGKPLIEDVAKEIGQSVLSGLAGAMGARILATAAQDTSRLVADGILPAVILGTRAAESVIGGALPRVEKAEEGDKTKPADDPKKALENWNKAIEDVGVPEGPYKDLVLEFGQQLIDGKLDKSKLQEMMKKAHESDSDHYAAWKSIQKLNDLLKPNGMRIDVDPKAWEVRLSDTIIKDEWSVSMGVGLNGDGYFSKRKFLDPEGKGPGILANKKEDITPEDAFRHLSSKFKGIINR